MTGTIFVTEAQVKAAQMIVERDLALGRKPDRATLKIAEAGRERPAGNTPGRPDGSPPPSGTFWSALDQAEQEALMSLASWQTFAAGETLMEQGEPADRVVVIFGGRTKITAIKDGRESVLAIRDVGQLVGERAALQASVRSATVTALEMVWAMVVSREAFASFLAARPRVMSILHDQLYERLSEGPTAEPVHDYEPAAGYSRRYPTMLNGENCTVVRSDVARFGDRVPSDRLLIRDALRTMIDAASQGISGVRTFDQGDGFLTVLPPNVSTEEVMNRLLKELPSAIERHNQSHDESARIQLRLAVNVGPVFGDNAEVRGDTITVTSRLLEASQFVNAIADDAILAIVISPFVFEAVIRPGLSLEELVSYTQVPVEVSGSSTIAWMKTILSDRPARSIPV